MEQFHEFYNTVSDAQTKFSVNCAKPEFLEIKCDIEMVDGENAAIVVKGERIIDTHVFDVKLEDDASAYGSEIEAEANKNTPMGSASPDTFVHFASEYDSKSVNREKIAMNGTAALINRVDHLIPNYLDMNCEICEQPFGSFTEANSHYRHIHRRPSVTLRCCQRRMKMCDIRSHIHYHLNPDMFKYGIGADFRSELCPEV